MALETAGNDEVGRRANWSELCKQEVRLKTAGNHSSISTGPLPQFPLSYDTPLTSIHTTQNHAHSTRWSIYPRYQRCC